MVRQGRKSRQIMQKYIARTETAWDSSTYVEQTLLCELDEEVTVKRIRIHSNFVLSDQADALQVFEWAIVQVQTDALATIPAPLYNQMTEDNLVVATGTIVGSAAIPGQVLEYDHTITMRKLKGSSVWLIMNLQDTGSSLAGTAVQHVYSQIHYLEDA